MTFAAMCSYSYINTWCTCSLFSSLARDNFMYMYLVLYTQFTECTVRVLIDWYLFFLGRLSHKKVIPGIFCGYTHLSGLGVPRDFNQQAAAAPSHVSVFPSRSTHTIVCVFFYVFVVCERLPNKKKTLRAGRPMPSIMQHVTTELQSCAIMNVPLGCRSSTDTVVC